MSRPRSPNRPISPDPMFPFPAIQTDCCIIVAVVSCSVFVVGADNGTRPSVRRSLPLNRRCCGRSSPHLRCLPCPNFFGRSQAAVLEGPLETVAEFEFDLCADVVGVDCPLAVGDDFSGSLSWNGEHATCCSQNSRLWA